MTDARTSACGATLERLSAYVDGELPDAEADDVAAHVAACHSCSVALDALMQTIGTLHDALPRLAAPDTLQQRVRTAIRTQAEAPAAPPEPSARAASATWRWPTDARRWLAAAGAGLGIAAASVLLTLALVRGDGTARTVSDLEASHVRSLMLDHLVDVPTSDRHTVKPWFAGKIDYAPTVPNVDAAGFTLVGGRLDYVAGRRVGVAVYRRRQHVINLYAWPASGGGASTVQRDGYSFVRWQGDGAEHWAVSDVSLAELREFVRLVQGKGEAESESRP